MCVYACRVFADSPQCNLIKLLQYKKASFFVVALLESKISDTYLMSALSFHTVRPSPAGDSTHSEEKYYLQACAVDTARNEATKVAGSATGDDTEEWDRIIQACREIWTVQDRGSVDCANRRVYSETRSKQSELYSLDEPAGYLPSVTKDQHKQSISLASSPGFFSAYAASPGTSPSVSPDTASVRISPGVHLRGQDSFHEFVQRVVYLFEQQRSKWQYQFAVLFLTPLPILNITAENMIFRTQTGEVSTPSEATNSESLMFPPDHNLCNYMTARPHGRCHAEVRLMDNLETLLSTYKSLGITHCQSIVLYTWLLPCLHCAEHIIRTLQDYIIEREYEVTVIYTCKQKDLKDEEIVKILNYFELAGIDALYVPFDQLLKRGSPLT